MQTYCCRFERRVQCMNSKERWIAFSCAAMQFLRIFLLFCFHGSSRITISKGLFVLRLLRCLMAAILKHQTQHILNAVAPHCLQLKISTLHAQTICTISMLPRSTGPRASL